MSHTDFVPRFRDIREYTDRPFDCATHGQVFMVLQFDEITDDPTGTYCAKCIKEFFDKPANGIKRAQLR